jgi:glyoxylate/hydroxypyruvate reductase
MLAGHIAHAVLDVFEPEPLPLESRLWNYPTDRVRIFPHVASPTNRNTAIQLIADNYKRSAALQPMENVVDTTAGY